MSEKCTFLGSKKAPKIAFLGQAGRASKLGPQRLRVELGV